MHASTWSAIVEFGNRDEYFIFREGEKRKKEPNRRADRSPEARISCMYTVVALFVVLMCTVILRTQCESYPLLLSSALSELSQLLYL